MYGQNRLQKMLDSYQAKHNEFRIVDVLKMQYLMVDGHGDPNTSKEFSDAIAALYPVAYKLKFVSKLELKSTAHCETQEEAGLDIPLHLFRRCNFSRHKRYFNRRKPLGRSTR